MKSEIPEQHTGGEIDTVKRVEFNSADEAKDFYQIAKERLLNVSHWAEICKVPLSTFTLTDSHGNTITRNAAEGDYIKIDIPGPGSHHGDGFDWVRIEKISEETESGMQQLSLQARPSPNPGHSDPDIAHFYTDQATSTFQVKRIGFIVTAEEHGRNEVPNTDTSFLTDNIRNTLVGWSAKIGFAYPQWKSLVKGIAETEPD